jgi:hypothetical protein
MRKRLIVLAVGCFIALCFRMVASERSKDSFPIGLFEFETMDDRWRAAIRLQGIDCCAPGFNPFNPDPWYHNYNVELLPDTMEQAARYGYKMYVRPRPHEKFWDWEREWRNNQWEYKYHLGSTWYPQIAFNALVSDTAAYVDSLLESASRGYASITGYWLWHEPYHKHDPNPHHGFDMRDSVGVYPIMKWQIEQNTDSLHSPYVFFCYREDTIRHHCFMHWADVAADTVYDNRAYYFSIAYYPCLYLRSIGYSPRFSEFSARMDTASRIGREALPTDPCQLRTFMDTYADYYQSPTPNHRFSTPEELRELVNLAILHGSKGYNYFAGRKAGKIIGLLDSLLVPLDVPYEEYVYSRNHHWYPEPDTFHPFGDAHPTNYVDPYRTLPPKPGPDTLGHKGWEIYYTWKYAPYGRNFRALGSINRSVHKMKDKLRYLWDADSTVATTVPDDTTRIEIITLSDQPQGGIAADGRVALFFVDKDFWYGDSSQYGRQVFTVCIDTLKLPSRFHPVNSNCKPLDIEERRVRPWYGQPPAGQRGFRVDLTSGQGKLVELVTGSEVRDFTVADPDIYFTDPPDTSQPDSVRYFLGVFAEDEDFVEGETAELCAKVFNIGFTAGDSVTVIFYDGDPRGGINIIGSTNVALPALSDTSSSMAIAHVQWQLREGTAGPHDIHVVVNHQWQQTDAGYTRYFYLSESDSSNNHGHSLLYVYPRDYATEIVGDPWDMDEDTTLTWYTPDIDSVQEGVLDPDSISGAAELSDTSGTDDMHVFLNTGWSTYYIDPDSFWLFSARIYVSDTCSLQVFWYNYDEQEEKLPVYPNPIPLYGGQWNVVTQDLTEGDSTWDNTPWINCFGILFITDDEIRVRLSWARLIR